MYLFLLTQSDAMSGFGKHDMDIHNEELRMATEVLHKTVIPKFASLLDCQDVSKLRLLTEMMHREGINTRHLV